MLSEETKKIDSIEDTHKHIRRVGELMQGAITALVGRAVQHDASKLLSPEREAFDGLATKLWNIEYGSDEYKRIIRETLGPALRHHYQVNSHHPEHYSRGVLDMSLLDLLEMMCDWKAAGERHETGSFFKSLTINQARFSMSDDLVGILLNTALELGWMTKEESQNFSAKTLAPKPSVNFGNV